jgi:predicted ArsR family transcriptional regulator
MKTSRQRLLDYIRTHRLATASEISRAMRMTEANARHHLEVLKEQGLVEAVGQRPQPGKGRPSLVYGLSASALGHNLDSLSSALLAEIENLPAPQRQAAYQRLAARMACAHMPVPTSTVQPSPLQPSKLTKPSLTGQLYKTIRRLNELHYQAHWEAHVDAPRIILAHCPYIALLHQHPQICQLDACLLETLLESPVKQLARLTPDAKDLTQCVFQLTHYSSAIHQVSQQQSENFAIQ